jgi:polysaccharide export outer membrane protein
VDGEGTINLPKLERIYVSGLTINELNSVLNEAYLKFIKFPQVETIITSYRPIRVFVDGEVVNPGLKTMQGSFSLQVQNSDPDRFNESSINNGIKGESNVSMFSNQAYNSNNNVNFYFPTVFDAIRASGGITQYSSLNNIQIIRKNNISSGSGKKMTTINFEDLLTVGENSQNIRIYDSDMIIVKRNQEPNKKLLTKAILSSLNPRFINVFVSGRVNRPGNTTVSRTSVLSDAVDMAGGAKIIRGPITFIRFESDGSIDKRKIRLTKKREVNSVIPL